MMLRFASAEVTLWFYLARLGAWFYLACVVGQPLSDALHAMFGASMFWTWCPLLITLPLTFRVRGWLRRHVSRVF